MDPRLLLGVSARAGRAEVRAAHRRLRRAVDPSRGGTPELARLVDAAADALAGAGAGAAFLAVPPDPRRVLGLAEGAGRRDAHDAYRRLSRLVHPDLGGTDELFRVVAAAHEELTVGVGRRARTTHPPGWRPPPPSSPPPPPPPRGPYRAPGPDDRHFVPPLRAVRELAWHMSVLVLAASALAVGFSLSRVVGIAISVGLVLATSAVLRPAVEGVVRSVVVLLGSRVRIAAAVAPERFLEASCLDAPVGRQPEGELYAAYVRWCRPIGTPPVARWVFVERLRTLGLLLVKASSWEDGLWVGITLRRTA